MVSKKDDTERTLPVITLDESLADHDPKDTIRPPSDSSRGTPRRYLPLPKLDIQSDARLPGQFKLEEVLAEGGQGLIRLAIQLPLGRRVAVKTVRAERRNDDTTQALLTEGWLTGLLEHPNVVPVYALGEDTDGAPMLAMKRIGGVRWREYVNSEDRLKEEQDVQDPLGWHLDVLMQVCNAVRFAHNRGIIHRDLKTDNVMIGHFGEVYVLDWGVAVSLLEEDRDRLPLAADVDRPTGTPCYMAPEMAAGDGAAIGETTDVYLLGAILHEILTGEPRHTGANVSQILIAAYVSEPADYGPDVPSELADLCNKATARDPKDRFQTVGEFRRALAQFIAHGVSKRMTEEADRVRGAMQQTLETSPHNLAEAYRLFGECRFGYRQALQTWRDNPLAADGMRASYEIMIGHELSLRDVKAASVLLDEMQTPNEKLTKEIERLQSELDAEEKDIATLKADHDLELGSWARVKFLLALGCGWSVVQLAIMLYKRVSSSEMSSVGYQYLGIVFLVVVVGLALWVQRTLRPTLVNRRIIRSFYALALMTVHFRLIAPALGLDVPTLYCIEGVLLAWFIGLASITIDGRLWKVAAVYGLESILTLYNPRYAYEINALADMSAWVLAAWIWYQVKGSVSVSEQPDAG